MDAPVGAVRRETLVDGGAIQPAPMSGSSILVALIAVALKRLRLPRADDR